MADLRIMKDRKIEPWRREGLSAAKDVVHTGEVALKFLGSIDVLAPEDTQEVSLEKRN